MFRLQVSFIDQQTGQEHGDTTQLPEAQGAVSDTGKRVVSIFSTGLFLG